MEDMISIELLGAGICEVMGEEAEHDAGNPFGHSLIAEDIVIVEEADVINAKLNQSFGIRYLINGAQDEEDEEVEVEFVCKLIHPPMVNPSGERFTETVDPRVEVLGDITFDYFRFEQEWELVAGVWRFTVQQGDEMLLIKDFVVRV